MMLAPILLAPILLARCKHRIGHPPILSTWFSVLVLVRSHMVLKATHIRAPRNAMISTAMATEMTPSPVSPDRREPFGLGARGARAPWSSANSHAVVVDMRGSFRAAIRSWG